MFKPYALIEIFKLAFRFFSVKNIVVAQLNRFVCLYFV